MVANRTAAKTARPARKASAASKKSAPAAKRKAAPKNAKTASTAKGAKTTKSTGSKTTESTASEPAKTAAGKTPAGASARTAAKKTAAKTSAKKPAAKKTAAKKTSPRKTSAPPRKTTPAKKSAPADQRGVAREPSAASPRETPGATRGGNRGRTRTGAETVANKTAVGAEPARASSLPAVRAAAEAAGIVEPGALAVRAGEDPWSPQEVADARAELGAEVRRLRTEISLSEEAVSGLMRDSGDGAGDDQADVGTKNISREHEMALANNAREMLTQTEHALERLDNGTYGLCESCGNPIGKARMQAFPRATLCVECKQRSERR